MEKLGRALGWAIRIGAAWYIVDVLVTIAQDLRDGFDPEYVVEHQGAIAWYLVQATWIPCLLLAFGGKAGRAIVHLVYRSGQTSKERLGRSLGWLLTIGAAVYVLLTAWGLLEFAYGTVITKESDYLREQSAGLRRWIAEKPGDFLWNTVQTFWPLLLPLLLGFPIGKAVARLTYWVSDYIFAALRKAPAATAKITAAAVHQAHSARRRQGRIKLVGPVLIAVGVVWAIVAFNADTTVSAGYERVHNIGLMDERRNHLIVAALLVLVGAIMLGVGTRSSERPRDSVGPGLASAPVPGPSKAAAFTSEREINSDAYQLYLVRKYGIEKNAVLEKYVVHDRLFATLNEALMHAHALDVGDQVG